MNKHPKRPRQEEPRREAHQHVLCRAQQPEYQDALAPNDAADECVFKEGREPRARDGRWRDQAALGNERRCGRA